MVPRPLGSCLSFLCLLTTLALSLQGQETGNPTVSLSTTAVRVEENADSTITIEINASAPLQQAQVFGLLLQGTGVVREDFVDQPQNIEIPAGANKGTVNLLIRDDTLIEGTETVTASLNNIPDGIDLAPQSETSFDIIDDDFANFTLSSPESNGTEGASALTIEIELDLSNRQLQKELIIDLSIDSTAPAIGVIGAPDAPLIPGQDFRVFPAQLVFSAAAVQGEKRTVEIFLLNDRLIEGEETSTLTFASSSDIAASNSAKTHTLKIADRNIPAFQFSSPETVMSESDSSADIGIQLKLGDNQLATNLNLEIVAGETDSAIGNFPANDNIASDYSIAPFNLSFASGAADGTTVVAKVEAIADQLIEGEEIANLSLRLVTTGFPQFTPPPSHALKIQDANLASIQFESNTTNVAEGDNTLTINAILDTGNASLATGIQVAVFDKNIGEAVGRFGPAAALQALEDNVDFEIADTLLSFSTGDQNETTRSFSIQSISDQLVEGTEFATLGLRVVSGPASIGKQSQHEYIIADANAATVGFSSPDITLAEGTTEQALGLTLQTQGATLAVPIQVEIVALDNSTAIGDIQSPPNEALTLAPANVGVDYEIPNAVITFPVGSSDQESKSFLASTLTDQLIEGEEIGNLRLGQLSGPVTPGTANQFAIKITDSNQGSIGFQTASSRITEANGTSLEVTFSLNTSGATLARAFAFPFSVTDVTANRSTDFELPNSLQLEWPANAQDGDTRAITFPIRNDLILEENETFDIQLQAPPPPFSLAVNPLHTATIEDDDMALIGLVSLNDSPTEGGDPIQIAIDLSQASSSDTEIKLQLTGSASSSSTELSETLPAGVIRGVLILDIVDDDLVEEVETLQVRLTSIQRGDRDIQIDVENQEKALRILDNDSSQVSLSSERGAAEDEQAGQLTVELTKGVEQPLKFELSFSGTATENADYTTPFTQITVPVRATSVGFEIPVLADNLAEGQEIIEVAIRGVDLPDLPISVQEDRFQIPILDDDASPLGVPDLGAGFTVAEDGTLNLGPDAGVLANDTDEDDGNGPDNLTASLDGPGPNNAAAFSFNEDGSFSFQPSPNFNGVTSFRYIASDGTNPSAPTLVTLTVTAVNDPPTQQVPGAQTVLEGGTLTFSSATQNSIQVADLDLGEGSLSVTLSARGSLSLASAAGLNFSQGDGSSDSLMTFTGALEAVNRALDGLRYQTPAGAAPDSINLVTNDEGNTGVGGALEIRSSIPITIQALNTPPLLTLPEETALAITGTGTPQAVSPGLTITDAEDATLASATVHVSRNFQSSEDSLSLPALPEGITGAFDSNTGILNLKGPAPLASFQTLLRQIRFGNSSASPNTEARAVSFTVSDGTVSSDIASREISVSSPAFPPSLTLGLGTERTFTEGGLPVSIAGGISVSEGSAGQIVEATIRVSGGFLSAEDQLRGGTNNGLSSHFDATTGTLTISGSASANIYSRALASVVYNNLSDSPGSSQRTFTISVRDTERSSNTVSSTLSVKPTNDAPFLLFTPAAAIPFEQGASPVTIFADLTITDSDHRTMSAATVMFATRFDAQQDRLSVGSLPGSLKSGGFNPDNGTLTIEGKAPIADYEQAIEALTYRNESDFNTDRTLTISVAVADPDGSTSNTVRQPFRLIGKSTPPEILDLTDTHFPEDTKAFELRFSVRDDKTPAKDVLVEVSLEKPEDFFQEEGVLIQREGGRFTLTLLPLPNAFGEIPIRVIAKDTQDLQSEKTILLTIEPANDLPVISASPLEPLIYQDGSGPRPLFDTFEIKDPDQAPLFGAILSFESGFLPQQDSLSIVAAPPIEASINRGSGEIRLTGKGTAKQYAEAILSIQYSNRSHLPSEGKRVLNLTVFDTEQTKSKTIPLEIRVLDANLPPTGKSDQISANGEPTVKIPLAQLLANDSDPDGDPLVISLFNTRTRNGTPILVSGDSVSIKSPEAGTTDSFYYTLSDQRGGYSSVAVTLRP